VLKEVALGPEDKEGFLGDREGVVSLEGLVVARGEEGEAEGGETGPQDSGHGLLLFLHLPSIYGSFGSGLFFLSMHRVWRLEDSHVQYDIQNHFMVFYCPATKTLLVIATHNLMLVNGIGGGAN